MSDQRSLIIVVDGKRGGGGGGGWGEPILHVLACCASLASRRSEVWPHKGSFTTTRYYVCVRDERALMMAMMCERSGIADDNC